MGIGQCVGYGSYLKDKVVIFCLSLLSGSVLMLSRQSYSVLGSGT